MNNLRGTAQRWIFSRVTIAALIGTVLVGVAIGTALAALGVRTPFAPVYDRFTGGNDQHAAISAQQPITVGDTTIQLVRVVASSSQTLAELAIDDPVFTETDDINAILPVNPADDLNLSGFASGPIGQRSTMDGQTKRVLLDLPPLASFDDMAAIEIVSLKRKGEDNAYQTIAGHWRFTFVPDVHEDMRFSQRIQISQQVEAGGQVISVEDVHLSATEAVVSYATHDGPGVFRESIGAPTMHYDEGVSKANTRQEPGTNNFTAHFPPLPEGVDNFSVVFGPSLASVPEQLQITLDLPAISEDSGSTLELDQIVTVDGASLRFTELVMNPSSFTLTYEPANTASSFRILAGPRSDITATDDLGVSYHGESRGTRLDRETGALLWQQLDFSGSLSDAPQSITLTFEGSGRIDPPLPPIEVAVPTRQ